MGISSPNNNNEDGGGDDNNDPNPTTAATTTATAIPQPHYGWWNPYRTWKDCLFQVLSYWILPFYKLDNVKQPHRSSSDAIESINELRDKFNAIKNMGFINKNKNDGFWLWEKLAGAGAGAGGASSNNENENDNDDNDSGCYCPIVEVLYEIPRRPNLLKEWGIVDDASAGEKGAVGEEDIPVGPDDADNDNNNMVVNMYFPISILKKKKKKDGEEDHNQLGEQTEFGYYKLDNNVNDKDFNLNDLVSDENDDGCPIIIYFHGGGLTIGDAYDHPGIDTFTKVLDEATTGKAIFASVEYSLSPEAVFPTPAIEAITVVSHFIENCSSSNHKIHVAGISAGGYLALVSSMECYRHYPAEKNSISSIVAMCPMLDPACDSMSYYMNSYSACSMCNFIKWCWKAYLELQPPVQVSSSQASNNDNNNNKQQQLPIPPPGNNDPSSLEDILGHNSNRAAWQQSKWYGTSYERLIKPVVDIPTGLLSNNTADASSPPKIVISTNKADPLCSEGIEYVNKLQTMSQANNVVHLDHDGSHWVGTNFDPTAYNELVVAWKELLF